MNLTLIRGMPGSGKTTLATQLAGETGVHLEADQFFTDEDGRYAYDGSRIGEAHEWCQDWTKNSLRMGKDVFVSNTFTTINELRPYFFIGKDFGILPTVILCQNDWGSIHDVPIGTLLNMQKRFALNIQSLFQEFK